MLMVFNFRLVILQMFSQIGELVLQFGKVKNLKIKKILN